MIIGWLALIYNYIIDTELQTPLRKLSHLQTSRILFRTQINYADNFRHPKLTTEEMKLGARLGIDSWADTSCAGRHAFVESFIEGKVVNASGFSPSLGSLSNLPIVNALYAYDTYDGQTFILENNNAIYLGNQMTDSLINPIQAEDNEVRIDIRPKRFYVNSGENCQQIVFPDGNKIPIEYDGVLPFIPIRRPTPDEIDTCQRLLLTSNDEWDPYNYTGFAASTVSTNDSINMEFDPLESLLSFSNVASFKTLRPILLPFHETYCTIQSIRSKSRSKVTPEQLSKLWMIGLQTAERTLSATTHKCLRTTGMLSRRYKTDASQLKYKQLSRVFGTFYCDYLKVGVKFVRGFIGGTLFTNKIGFKKFYPSQDEKGSTTAYTLRSFIDFVGLPYSLHSDGHSNFAEGPLRKLLRKFGIKQTYTEPYSPWQNRAEYAIGEVKKHARRLMQTTCTPVRLWCFCYEYSADLLSICATGRYVLKGRTPYECTMNYTPDISEYASFQWYQWCWYFNEQTNSKDLVRWLGPAHHVGQAFCSYLLRDTAEVITRSSVIPVTDEEMETAAIQSLQNAFTNKVEAKIGNHRQPIFDPVNPDKIYYTAFNDEPIDDVYDLP